MPHLLDTNVAIRLRDNEPAAIARLADFPEPMLSVVSVVELENGVYSNAEHSAEKRAYLDSFLPSLEVVPFDMETAAVYGRIVAQLGYSRKQVLDRMIAATALVRGAPVVTSNTTDFHGIRGLQLRKW